jgi:hypothetical protein
MRFWSSWLRVVHGRFAVHHFQLQVGVSQPQQRLACRQGRAFFHQHLLHRAGLCRIQVHGVQRLHYPVDSRELLKVASGNGTDGQPAGRHV